MSDVEIQSGEAVAAYLSQRFPNHTVKRVARCLPGVSTRTIERWMQGHRPNGTHMDRLIALFGIEFLQSVWSAVFQPLDTDEAIERLAHVEREIAALRQTFAGRMDTRQDEPPLAPGGETRRPRTQNSKPRRSS